VPLVSVIIPNYNHGLFLEQRIESVLNQIFQDFEVIILDDCSTDDSKEIIEEYRKDLKVKHIVYNDKNSGSTFKQWQKGIELASGEYIWIAESDDFNNSTFLEVIVNKFAEDKSIGLAYCQSTGVNENGEILNSWLQHTEDLDENLWKADFCLPGKQFIKQFLLLKNPIPNVSAVVFKKELCIRVGAVNTSFTLNGDWDLYSRILLFCKIAFIYKPLNNFRQHSKKGSSANIINGNNIKEYYWLAKEWSVSLEITIPEKKKLLEHIYSIWYTQVGGSRLKLFSNNFLNIFPSAFKVDKGILLKIVQK
jgi:glycosyltransferase involved in cell wall biosynthesis